MKASAVFILIGICNFVLAVALVAAKQQDEATMRLYYRPDGSALNIRAIADGQYEHGRDPALIIDDPNVPLGVLRSASRFHTPGARINVTDEERQRWRDRYGTELAPTWEIVSRELLADFAPRDGAVFFCVPTR